jgi:tRNA (cytidine/uridine-2'-O-)-methyltransferase
MRIALYQPDIPQNSGTILRLAACMNVGVDIIEPCGFVWSDTRMRRAGMDYLDLVHMQRHPSWQAYCGIPKGRLVLLTTRGTDPYTKFTFRPDDTLLLGSESAGVPDAVHDMSDARLRIPMAATARSLNIALAAAMVLGEALRQTDGYPEQPAADRKVDE